MSKTNQTAEEIRVDGDCSHPLGFDFFPPTGDLRCFDCRAQCPGKCVCGAPFQSMQCRNHGHLRGAELATSPPAGAER